MSKDRLKKARFFPKKIFSSLETMANENGGIGAGKYREYEHAPFSYRCEEIYEDISTAVPYCVWGYADVIPGLATELTLSGIDIVVNDTAVLAVNESLDAPRGSLYSRVSFADWRNELRVYPLSVKGVLLFLRELVS